jgi:hypothetical protein
LIDNIEPITKKNIITKIINFRGVIQASNNENIKEALNKLETALKNKTSLLKYLNEMQLLIIASGQSEKDIGIAFKEALPLYQLIDQKISKSDAAIISLTRRKRKSPTKKDFDTEDINAKNISENSIIKDIPEIILNTLEEKNPISNTQSNSTDETANEDKIKAYTKTVRKTKINTKFKKNKQKFNSEAELPTKLNTQIPSKEEEQNTNKDKKIIQEDTKRLNSKAELKTKSDTQEENISYTHRIGIHNISKIILSQSENIKNPSEETPTLINNTLSKINDINL